MSLLSRPIASLAVEVFRRAPRRRRDAVGALAHERSFLEFEGRRVAIYKGGQGPKVLLVHGWGGASSQWNPVAANLLRAGYQVTTLDLPAHGSSTGGSTDIGQITRLLYQLTTQAGPFHATVAHSLATPAVARAAADGEPLGRLVLIAGVTTPRAYWDRFKSQLHLPKRIAREADQNFESRMGRRMAAMNMQSTIPQVRSELCFIHDTRDRIAAIDPVAELSEAHGHSLLRTKGLGHSRLLADRHVVDRVTAFVRGEDLDDTEVYDPEASLERQIEAELANPALRRIHA